MYVCLDLDCRKGKMGSRWILRVQVGLVVAASDTVVPDLTGVLTFWIIESQCLHKAFTLLKRRESQLHSRVFHCIIVNSEWLC